MNKKLSLILVSIMLIVTCCFGLVSCNNGDNTPAPSTATVFGLLGEPAVTASQSNGLTYGLDLQELYKDATKTSSNSGYGYPQAVVIVNSNFLRDHEDVVGRFIDAMIENVEYINTDANKAGITEILKNNRFSETQKSNSTFPVPAIAKCGVKVDNSQVTLDETVELLKTIGIPSVNNDFFYSLSNTTPETLSTNTLTVAVPDGAPALAVTKIVKDGIEGITNLSLDITQPPLIKNKVAAGQLDIAILPSNVAYALFNQANKSGAVPYKMVASATYGNLHIVANGTVNTLNDLVGKVIYSIGENAIPHKVFAKVCAANDIELNVIKDAKADTIATDKINIIFKKDGPSVIGAIKASK